MKVLHPRTALPITSCQPRRGADDGGAAAVAVLEDFEQVVTGLVVERLPSWDPRYASLPIEHFQRT